MAERYTRLFSLDSNIYSSGSPVLIAAGALLSDSFSSNMLAQLKFRVLSEKKLAALTVAVTMKDSVGRALGKAVEYQYTDLDAGRDAQFGRNVAIVLPESAVRSFTVSVREVVFADGEIWQASAPWAALALQESLSAAYGGDEIAAQYRIRYGEDCKFAPLETEELWFCTCGAPNRRDEQKCHACRRGLSAQRSVNISTLRAESAERVKAEAEQEELEKAAAAGKRKKRLILAVALIPVLVLAALLIATVPRTIEQSRAYSSAVALLELRRFDLAEDAFIALGQYRDSAEQVEKNIPYEKAVYIMECAAEEDRSAMALAGISLSETNTTPLSLLLYRAAMERFLALGDYKDSSEKAALCQSAIDAVIQARSQEFYDDAAALLASGAYCQARDAFLELGDFSDSAVMVKESIYRKAVSLYAFMEEYDIRGIYSSLSTETSQPSAFYVEKSVALRHGSGFVTALSAACGGDGADIYLDEAVPSDALPYAESLTRLFLSMDGYGASEEYIEKIEIATDYTRDFFTYCGEGRIYEAYDWLVNYEDEFEDRDYWLELLDAYKPFCDDWELRSGDATLLPLTVGQSQACTSFSTCVIISGDTATLRFTGKSGEADFTVDFPVELGAVKFVLADDSGSTYIAAISVVDCLAYMKYDGKGVLRSSCEYSRAA